MTLASLPPAKIVTCVLLVGTNGACRSMKLPARSLIGWPMSRARSSIALLRTALGQAQVAMVDGAAGGLQLAPQDLDVARAIWAVA